jgi:pimeloyl-ACP methyl ester carboxylesterase
VARPLPLHYEVFGSGPPVVILHGLFGSSRNWRSVARALASEYAAYTVDLRNHGRSPHTGSMDYRALADDVRALMDTLDLDDVTLLGHSMGGKTAMTLALRDPSRLSRLIIVDIAPVAYADQHTHLIDAMSALPLERVRRRSDADRMLRDAIPDESLRLFLLQNLVLGPSGTHWRFNLEVLRSEMPILVGPLPGLRTTRYEGRTTFIRGGRSDRVLTEHEAIVSRHFPNYDILTIPSAGHWPHAETPDEFLRLLKRILEAET